MSATLPFRRRNTRTTKKLATLTAAGAVTAAGVLAAGAFAAPAGAATGDQHGRFAQVWQDTTTHALHVSGYGYDGRPGHRQRAPRSPLPACARSSVCAVAPAMAVPFLSQR